MKMEALVNYSSEDEQDELSYQKVAERDGSSSGVGGGGGGGGGGSGGTPLKLLSNGHSDDDDSDSNTHERSTSNGSGRGGGSGTSSGRHTHREETLSASKHNSMPSYHRAGGNGYDKESNGNNRLDRERDSRDSRHKHDAREGRGSRDSRDYKSSQHDRRNTKDRYDYKRDSNDKYRDGRRDERGSNHYHQHSRYTAPSSSSTSSQHYSSHNRSNNGKSERYSGSSSKNVRDDRSRNSDSSRRTHHHHQQQPNRGRDERGRDEHGRDDRLNRHEPRSRHSQRARESKSRSRSRSPVRQSPPKERAERHAPPEPLEQARQSALEMERKLNAHLVMEQSQPSTEQWNATNFAGGINSVNTNHTNPAAPIARRIEALLSLPLSDMATKQTSVIAVTGPSNNSTGSVLATAENEPAVIQLPGYYNPSVINPNKYAEQMQKRKLLWGAKKSEDAATKWNHAQFSQDTDGKVASKFMRLMGIKSGGGGYGGSSGGGSGGGGIGGSSSSSEVPATEAAEKKAPSPTPDVKFREAMFSNMEQQYEVARQATHTMRGVGLGFGSQTRPF